MGNRASKAMRELRAVIFNHLRSKGIMDIKLASLAALYAVEALMEYSSGTSIYIPHTDFEIRNAIICQKFTGNNHSDLAREFHLTGRQIYNILSRAERQAG